MRYILILCFFVAVYQSYAQPASGEGDAFLIVDEMPRFPGCEDLEGSIAEKDNCAKEKLLAFVYDNIAYPDSALEKGIEGTVVLRFIVDKEGKVTNDTILKDIGGGCGEAALNVVRSMNEMPEKWTPGIHKGKAASVYFTLPVKFKIKKPVIDPDFVILDGDSIWVKFDETVQFKGGEEAFQAYMSAQLEYPFIGNIDCLIGVIQMKILVRSDGSVKVMDITDYNELGVHFWYEAIDFIHKSRGQWKVATFQGKAVNGTHDVRITFKPTYKCADIIENYDKAIKHVEEGIDLFESEQLVQAIEKFTVAVDLFPENPEFLAFRGQAFLEAERIEEACADLSKVRDLLYVPWYDQVLPLICK